MPFTLVSSLKAKSTDSNGFTSGSIDTTGASLLVLALAYIQGAQPTISDNYSNTWTGLTAQENAGAGGAVRLFYVANPFTGAGHTFTTTGAVGYPAIFVNAYNGARTSAPFDQQNGAQTSSAVTLATGSVTPTTNGQLVITGVGTNGTPSSINGGFTITNSSATVNGQAFGGGIADLIQTSIVAANPTWTMSGASGIAAAIATFIPASSGRMFLVF